MSIYVNVSLCLLFGAIFYDCMTNSNPHSVLYYPSIEFQSIEWVKKALLFWDHVYRIVPDGYKPDDSNEILLFKENNLIIDIPVSEGEKEKAAKSFLKFRESLKYLPSGLDVQTTDRLSKQKVDYRLIRLLDAIADKYDFKSDQDWYYFPSNIARGYMFTLAQTIAESCHLVRATDNLDIWSVSPYFTERGNFPFEDVPYKKGNEGVYCSLIVEDVLPENAGELLASDIVNFNVNRKDERTLFRNRINELVYRQPQIQSKEQWEDEIGFMLQDFERDKDNLKNSFSLKGTIMKNCALAVGLPTCLSAIGSQIFVENTQLLPSLIIAAIATIADYTLIKKNRNPSYASYLIDIENRSKFIPNIASQYMHEFIND